MASSPARYSNVEHLVGPRPPQSPPAIHHVEHREEPRFAQLLASLVDKPPADPIGAALAPTMLRKLPDPIMAPD